MKKIIIFSLFVAFIFSSHSSLAASYPATCDSTAQAVITGIGGCSAIDCTAYSNICAKCCVKVVAPVKTATTPAPSATAAPAPKPAVVPSTDSGQVQTPNSTSGTETLVIETKIPPIQTGSGLATSTTPKETTVNFVGFIKSVFAGLFRFFGFAGQ